MKPATSIKSALILSFGLLGSYALAEGPAASIDQLSWMTGSWAAALGPNTLEENWIKPTGGSIAAMVRMSGAENTSMFEVIVIEEKAGSLEMSIQQWGPGFAPRSEAAQKLALSSITDNSVMFSAITEGGIKTLGYSRPSESTFQIDMQAAQGQPVKVLLNAR